jgi:molybdopterin synthase catalytic subunit
LYFFDVFLFFLPKKYVECLVRQALKNLAMEKHNWSIYIIITMKTPPPGVYGKNSIGIEQLFRSVLEDVGDGSAGAAVFFVGLVKRQGEHANKALKRICEEVREEYGLRFVGVWHFLGSFGLGEAVVVAAAAGAGREETFAGLKKAVERYKREPALFKKEVYVDGTEAWLEGA